MLQVLSRSRYWVLGLFALALMLGMAPLVWADAGVPNFKAKPGQPPGPGAGGAAAFAIGWLACMAFAVIIGITIKVLIIMFIVKDCKKRGIDPTVWVILEVFAGLIGLIVYLCVREGMTQKRPYRGSEYDDYDNRGPRVNNDWDRDRRLPD